MQWLVVIQYIQIQYIQMLVILTIIKTATSKYFVVANRGELKTFEYYLVTFNVILVLIITHTNQ